MEDYIRQIEIFKIEQNYKIDPDLKFDDPKIYTY